MSDQREAGAETNHLHLTGQATKNAYMERFNQTYREEMWDLHLFITMTEAKIIAKERVEEHNAIRPHETLHGLTISADP